MPLGEFREEWKVWLSREGVWARYRTLGQVAVLEGEGLEVCFSFALLLLLKVGLLIFFPRCAGNSQGL